MGKIKLNDFISEKHKKTCKYLDHVKNLLILASTFNGCNSVSAFTYLAAVLVGITSSAVGLKIFPTIAGIKKFKSVTKKMKKNHEKIVLLEKAKLDIAEVLFSKALIDTYINYDEFVSVNNVFREYYEMKEKIKNPEIYVEYTILIWLIEAGKSMKTLV